MSEPTIGSVLRHLLDDAGETAESVAERLGKSRQAVDKQLRDGANPQWSTVVELLAAIGKTPYDLGVAYVARAGGAPPPYPRVWADQARLRGSDREMVAALRRSGDELHALADLQERIALAEVAEGGQLGSD